MEKKYELKVIVCVGYRGDGIILKFPEAFKHLFDGSYCDDNLFYGVPTESGVYVCDVEYWFSSGYSMEGYPSAGQDDWEFRVVQAKRLLDLNTIDV